MTAKQKSTKNLEEDHVRVAIRCRPFNSREKRKGSKLCVSMADKKTVTVWSEEKQKKKTFHFDYCYWSVNQDGPGMTSQEDVFTDLGHLYVDNAFKGYNSSVFAYGQTGSGKTFSMLGTAKSPGLIPRGCEELFRRIEQDYDDNVQIEIEASYLEVYMNQIFDLLANPEDQKKKKKSEKKREKLAIRFHPKKGLYVPGLTKHSVSNYRDIQKLMNIGLANRTVAETQMNKISSRSHCIFTLYMNQYNNDGAVVASKINLIDLAGSERVNKTGVAGTRLEELKTINKSLSALGDVISALADHAKFVPYNNSVLTTLLSESLGGNSKTIMLTAISPADDNFDESLSTLRYAERVKKIKQSAKKNRGDDKATVERELRSQIDKLKSQLDLRGSGNKDHVNQLNNYLETQRAELRRVKMEHTEKVGEMRDAYMKMQHNLAAMGLASVEDAKKSSTAPKLINVSGDPSLSGSLVFFITTEQLTIGTAMTATNQKKNPRKIPHIGLNSEGDIQAEHAVIKTVKITESKQQKAMDTRLYVWKLLFQECDRNKDGFLNKAEFEEWSTQVLQRDDFKGFSDDEFAKWCKEHKLASKNGVSWDVVRDTFADDGSGGADGAEKNVAEIVGIPKEKHNEQLIHDLKTMIFEDHNVLTLKLTEFATIAVDFQYDLTDADIESFQSELAELFEKTTYAKTVQIVRATRHDDDDGAGGNGSGGDQIEKVQITIESANAANDNIMIFVNKERVRYTPKELRHGDHILLGTRHIFQFLNPLESVQLGLGLAADEADEKQRQTAQHQIQAVLDQEKSTHHHVGSIFDMKSVMLNRLQNQQFRIGNADITTLQKDLLKQRNENVTSADGTGGGFRQLRDAFMDDYQTITSKCNSANQMSLQLDKAVLFDVGTLAYFDREKNCKHDRIVVTRTCHYSDPELQHQMMAAEFESLLKEMSYYHELAEDDGETIASETLEDDPFIPAQTETLLGEAKLKLSGRKIDKNVQVLPILTASGDKIGDFYVEVTFKLIDEHETNCYDFKKMENKAVKLIVGFESVKTQMELPYVRFTFCAVGKDIVTITNRKSGADDSRSGMFSEDVDDDEKQQQESVVVKRNKHVFEDSYEVPEILLTPSFHNFLSAPGITFKIWAPVFDSTAQMPPIISYKIRSKKVTLNVTLPDGEVLRLKCKTGNNIGSLKRKIEFRTEISDYQQKLFLDSVGLDNNRTLLDYDIKNEATLVLKVDDNQSLTDGGDVADKKPHRVSMRTSLIDLQPDDLRKELSNPNLSADERAKIRRIKNKSIHMAFLKEDLMNPSAMTLESMQEENTKLREELTRANQRIEQLERELAAANSKGKSKSSKVFGSWRRNAK